jgi:ribosomal RNA methyltransferase Nop2
VPDKISKKKQEVMVRRYTSLAINRDTPIAMGRRAKNKQPPPAPYVEHKRKAERVSNATNGKRKATDDVSKASTAKRPATNGLPTKKAKKQDNEESIFEDDQYFGEGSEDESGVGDDDEDGFPGLDDEGEDDESDDVDEGEESDPEIGEEDEFDVESEEEVEADDDPIAVLGLPTDKPLTTRQKKKALAEAERLEELLKSQGHSLNDDEISEEEDEIDGLFGEEEHTEDEAEESGSDDGDLILPTLDDGQAGPVTAADLQTVQMRIQEIVNVLNDFKPRTGHSRSDYTEQLLRDICHYYGYNRFLAEKFFELFSPTEALAFFEANETPRPVTIRANTLRTRRRDLAQALINRGVNLEPLPGKWTKVGLQVFESSVPIGATPEYLAGHYMLQAASSFLPCIALAPQPHERVLDMASAPGGKSTYLSALMQNTGVVFANDSNKARTKSLTANVHRLGCTNIVVSNYDARQFPKVIGGFDRVLLDSPCSGSGVVSKDASVKTNKSDRDLQLLTHIQKQLILCAIDSVNPRSKTGGYVVYSTCSVLVEENEQVVQYALEKRKNVRIVPTGIDFGREGFKKFRGRTFDDKMHLTKRIFPHVHNMDGFYFCKLKVEALSKSVTTVVPNATTSTSGQSAKTNDLTTTQFDEQDDSVLIEKSLQRRKSRKSH